MMEKPKDFFQSHHSSLTVKVFVLVLYFSPFLKVFLALAIKEFSLFIAL